MQAPGNCYGFPETGQDKMWNHAAQAASSCTPYVLAYQLLEGSQVRSSNR
jgi:hypothetical protein